MASAKINLVDALRVLKNSAPEEFEAFIRAFDYYTDEVTVAVLAASPAEILVAQGCGRQLHSLCQLIQDSKRDPKPAANPQP